MKLFTSKTAKKKLCQDKLFPKYNYSKFEFKLQLQKLLRRVKFSVESMSEIFNMEQK